MHGSGANERFGGGIEWLDQGDKRQLHTLGQFRYGGGGTHPFTLCRVNLCVVILRRVDGRGRELSRYLPRVLLHERFAAHFIQRAGAGGFPVHRLCRLLVLLLSEPAQGKETGTWGADGVAVCGGQPELAQQFAFASFPAERRLKLQAGAFCVLLSAGVQAHLRRAQYGVVHFATFDQQG